MNKRLAIAFGLCVALLGSYVYAQFGTEPAKLELVKLKDDLYVIHNDFVPGNVTALITSQGVLLVDVKFEIDYQNVVAQLKKVTNQPVRWIVNTHYHADHSGANARFQATNAQVFASQQARDRMLEIKQPGLPDVTLEDRLRLYPGGKRVEVLYLGRAHTDGDVVVLLPDHDTLATGDMFAFGDATPQLVDYPGGGSAREWPRTLDKALALDFETVVPGHGKVTNRQELRRFRDATVRLRDRVSEMIRQKQSRDAIAKMLMSEFKFTDFHLQSLDGLLAELR